MSQDLILATQELGSIMDTATRTHETESYHTALAHRCFYALYLTRIIVLSRFLDCLPRDIDIEFARTEWAVFQHAPPRLPNRDDVFSAVYRHVKRACSSVFDLKRTAEGRFNALFTRNRHLFHKKLYHPSNYPMVLKALENSLNVKFPFYLAIDEVEAPVYQNASSSRRPACSRLGVSALFYGFDKRF